jgi:hypothetical protein
MSVPPIQKAIRKTAYFCNYMISGKFNVFLGKSTPARIRGKGRVRLTPCLENRKDMPWLFESSLFFHHIKTS